MPRRPLACSLALNMSRVRRTTGENRSARLTHKRHSKERRPSSMRQQFKVIVGPLAIDRQRQSVRMGSRSIDLTPTEFALLWTLAARPGAVYRRQELLQRVWGKGVYVTLRTVDVHMSKLRHKLRTSANERSLAETVWGIGYRLRDPSS